MPHYHRINHGVSYYVRGSIKIDDSLLSNILNCINKLAEDQEVQL